MNADLPPSSRNTFLIVAAPSAITLRPVAVEPVNETMSTRGSLANIAPDAVVAGGDDVDNAGRKVGVLGDEFAEHGRTPRRVGRRLQDDGVAGGQRGPSLARLIWCGKFHGVIAPTTPTASRAIVRRVGIPIGDASPRSWFHT